MKKILFVLLALLPALTFGQRTFFAGSFGAPVGDDTVVYVSMATAYGFSIEFQYKDVGWDVEVDATLDIGSCAFPDGSAFHSQLDAPLDLVDSTLQVQGEYFLERYLAIKLIKNGVAPGTLLYYWITKI